MRLKVKKARTGYAAEGQYDSARASGISGSARTTLKKQKTETIKAISPSTTKTGQALKYGLMFSGVPFAKTITEKILDRGQNLGYGLSTKSKNTNRIKGTGFSNQKVIQPIIANKPVDKNLINERDNFFKFKAFNVGGLSGGVSYGPPPKRGPNPQVPPIKMKKGGLK